MSRILRTGASVIVLVVLIATLHLVGRLDLQGPQSLDRTEIELWFGDPVTVIATALRYVALACSYYLLLLVVLMGVFGRHHDSDVLRKLVPPALALPLAALLGVVAVAGPTVLSTGPGPDVPTSGGPLRLDPVGEPLTITEIDESAPVRRAEARRRAPSTGALRPVPPATDEARTPPRQNPSPPLHPDARITVELGDNFWTIAETQLEEAWGRHDLADREIVPYWMELIDRNRGRLVEPGNPDLILPGQVFVLPEPPADPRRP